MENCQKFTVDNGGWCSSSSWQNHGKCVLLQCKGRVK